MAYANYMRKVRIVQVSGTVYLNLHDEVDDVVIKKIEPTPL